VPQVADDNIEIFREQVAGKKLSYQYMLLLADEALKR